MNQTTRVSKTWHIHAMFVAPQHIVEATLTSNWKVSLESCFITQLKMQTHEMFFCWQNYSCNNRFNCTLPHIALMLSSFSSGGSMSQHQLALAAIQPHDPKWFHTSKYFSIYLGKINLSTHPPNFQCKEVVIFFGSPISNNLSSKTLRVCLDEDSWYSKSTRPGMPEQ